MSLVAYQARVSRGALPSIRIPGDDWHLSDWARALASALHDVEIYRRDRVIVVPFAEKKTLTPISEAAFCSWIEDHVTPTRTIMRDGDAIDVGTSIDLALAKKTLQSFHFWPHLRPIERCYPVPSWVTRSGSSMAVEFIDAGYDAATSSYVFPF